MPIPNALNDQPNSGANKPSVGDRIIRLAHARPEFRSALQPLLYVIAAKQEEDREINQREFSKLTSFGPRFGIISVGTQGSETEQKVRHADLLADLKRLGYRKVSPLRGKWNLVPEDSYVIQNIRPEDLFELGRKYGQDFVIFSNESGLVGFYYTKGEPKARIIVDPKGDTTFRSLTDMTPYSRAQGLDVDFGLLWSKEFAWDGRSPLSRKRIRQLLKSHGLKDVTPSSS